MKVLIINGPNLDLLGRREPSVYGASTLDDVEALVRGNACEIETDFFQSNHEGDIIDRIHSAGGEGVDAMILNPAAFTHTSVAIRDAILAVDIPFIEVHISNVASREAFRKVNYFSDIAKGTICGLGVYGYVLALEGLREMYGKQS